MRKFIHYFSFNYKHFTWSQLRSHKIELVQNSKALRQKSYRINPKYAKIVKIELEKLLEVGFIRPVENTEWVFPLTLAPNKNGILRICVNFKKLNEIMKKVQISFCDWVLEELTGHELYFFADGYNGYHQVKILNENHVHFTWGTFWGNAIRSLQCFSYLSKTNDKVLEPYLGHFVRVLMDDFRIYGDWASHLKKLKKVSEGLD